MDENMQHNIQEFSLINCMLRNSNSGFEDDNEPTFWSLLPAS